MSEENFTPLELEDIALALDQINPLLDESQYDPVQTTILAADLPFYHSYQLLKISDQTSHPIRTHYAVYSHGDPHVLNFTNEFIYALNKHIPIQLDKDNIYEYVLFFFRHVSGTHGRFLIVESIEDIAWKENPPPNARQAIANMIKPVALKEKRADGTYIFDAHMVFKNGLFRSDILVDHDGNIQMNNEELLIEDMPIIDDVVGQ
jgi:hypothetical protein